MSSSKKARTDYDVSTNPSQKNTTTDGGYKIKTYYPSLKDMKDFSAYIKHIHEDGGHRAGLAKIVPPTGYQPRKAGYADDSLYEMSIKSPIRQEVSGAKGLYQQLNVMNKKPIKVKDFKRMAEDKYPTPVHQSDDELERIFWKNIFTQPSIYGADVPGSLYDEDFEEFNLTRLNTILDNIGNDYGVTIQGVNTAYLYFGMWKTSFCWHTEDMDLYSINYLHFGEPKAWYCISPEHGKRFERLAESFFPHSAKTCRAFLRHKMTLISPAVLKKYSIPFSRCVQRAGEFMITFPYSYHSGFNHGFNIAEATNFAIEYWIDFGKWATRCECSPEAVKISMQTFVKRYQADRYENWLRGKDICKDPRDPKHTAAAPRPTEYDLYLIGSHDREVVDEEENKKNALQQNQSSNVKVKAKSSKKTYPSLQDTYEKYNQLFLQEGRQNQVESTMQLPHYSPIGVKFEPLERDHGGKYTESQLEGLKLLSTKLHKVDFDQSQILKPPDYDAKLLERERKRKKAHEEKLRLRREKRQRNQPIRPRDLLQYLPQTYTQEKRFNRCITAQPPHCSVCQIMVEHPKDNEDIWGSTPQDTSNNQTTATPNGTQIIELPETISGPSSQTNTEASDALALTWPSSAGPQVEEFKLPESSEILLPRCVFDRDPTLPPSPVPEATEQESNAEAKTETNGREGDSGYIADKSDFLDANYESSDLIQCCVCMLCVHKTCYGMKELPDNRSEWCCDRCQQQDRRSLINCELCPCRGGALKRYRDIWVHVTCILTIPGFKLTDLFEQNDQEDTTKKVKLSENHETGSCSYCVKNIAKYIQGRCIPCEGFINPCEAVFHPTCGHRNGAKFDCRNMHLDSADNTAPIVAMCAKCTEESKISGQEILEEEPDDDVIDSESTIPKGTPVIAFVNDDHMYLDGLVVDHKIETLFEVYVPQGNHTESYVESKRIRHFDSTKTYTLGERLQVRNGRGDKWKDCKLKSMCKMPLYQVKLKERDVYLPRKLIYFSVDELSEEALGKYRSVKFEEATELAVME